MKAGCGLVQLDLFTLVLVIFKLVGRLSWSWWWVLSPTWIPAALCMVLIVGIAAGDRLAHEVRRRQ